MEVISSTIDLKGLPVINSCLTKFEQEALKIHYQSHPHNIEFIHKVVILKLFLKKGHLTFLKYFRIQFLLGSKEMIMVVVADLVWKFLHFCYFWFIYSNFLTTFS
jgi:hypothetical protein